MKTPASRLSASPLEIQRHEFLRIELQAAEETDGDSPLPLKLHREWAAREDDSRQWRMLLTVHFGKKEGKAPRYSGSMQIAGYFRIADAYPEQKMSDLIGITGASILYGACREMLANITARSAHGMISLPSISFLSGEPKRQEKPTSTPVTALQKIKRSRSETPKRKQAK